MRPENGLRAPQMRIAGDHGIRIFARQVQQRRHQRPQQFARAVAFAAQPEARIERDLFIAAAAGVDLARQRADTFAELADNECVDVLIGRAIEERGRRGIHANGFEGVENPVAFGIGQDAGARQRAREGLRTFDIGFE